MQPDLYRTCISASFFPPSVLLDYNTLADDICPCYHHHGQPLYNQTARWAIFFFLTICVSWLMPGDWMGTNHILCQQNYKREASELKDTNWQFHPVESPCVWTSGVKQSGGKTGSWPFIPLFIIFFPPLRMAQLVSINNGRIWSTGHMARKSRLWNTMSHLVEPQK